MGLFKVFFSVFHVPLPPPPPYSKHTFIHIHTSTLPRTFTHIPSRFYSPTPTLAHSHTNHVHTFFFPSHPLSPHTHPPTPSLTLSHPLSPIPSYSSLSHPFPPTLLSLTHSLLLFSLSPCLTLSHPLSPIPSYSSLSHPFPPTLLSLSTVPKCEGS